MKISILLLAACLLASTPVFSQKNASTKTKKQPVRAAIGLSEAVAKNMVKLNFSGPGGHDLLKISIENPGASSVKIKIPQGQLFIPTNTGEQNLVVAEEQILLVSAKKSRDLELKTFCTESSDASPMLTSTFAVGTLATEPILKMLQYLKEEGKLADGSAQPAIWSVASSGKFNPAGIGNEETTREACQILNRRPPNYRIRYETRNVPGQPGFEGKALVVDGNYTYVLSKDEKLTLSLFDDTGNLVKVLYKGKTYTAGEHRASLHLEVKGLKQGKYVIKLATESGEIVKEQEVEF